MTQANEQIVSGKQVLTDAKSKIDPQTEQPNPILTDVKPKADLPVEPQETPNFKKDEPTLMKGNDCIKDDNRTLLEG